MHRTLWKHKIRHVIISFEVPGTENTMKTFLRNQIILPNRLHTADTRRCLENLEILKKNKNSFSEMKIIHTLDLHFFFFCLSLPPNVPNTITDFKGKIISGKLETYT